MCGNRCGRRFHRNSGDESFAALSVARCGALVAKFATLKFNNLVGWRSYMRAIQVMAVVLLALALAGCPKKPQVKPDTNAGTTSESGANTNSLPSTTTQSGSELERQQQAQLQELKRLGMVIYFDYDKSEIKTEFVNVLAAHAKFLNGNVNFKVRLEGHTDERGSREYNIGLGERRAQAVRRALLLQ